MGDIIPERTLHLIAAEINILYAKSLNIEKVMLGCYADNIASIKTITKCGGILTESRLYADGKPMNIYWIEIH